MEQHEGFVVTGQENEIYRLVKSLYGLKQLHIKFDNVLMANSFCINKHDKRVYVKVTR